MKCFLSSFACLDREYTLNPLNCFAEELKSVLISQIRGGFVAAMPDWRGVMDESAQYERVDRKVKHLF